MADSLTTSDVAILLGASVASISNWIDSGWLRAGKTPGGHRRIAPEDLIAFLRRQKLPVPAALAPRRLPRLLVFGRSQVRLNALCRKLRQELPRLHFLEAGDDLLAGAILGRERPSVVILELDELDAESLALCRRIESLAAGKDTTIIVIANTVTRAAKARAKASSVTAVLTRPWSMGELVKKIAAALDLGPEFFDDWSTSQKASEDRDEDLGSRANT